MPSILTTPSPYYHSIYVNDNWSLNAGLVNFDFNLKDYDDVILDLLFMENVAASQQADRLEAHVIGTGSLAGVYNAIQQLGAAVSANQLNAGVARVIHQTGTGALGKEKYCRARFHFRRNYVSTTIWNVFTEIQQTPDAPNGTLTVHVRGGGTFVDASNACNRIVLNLSGATGLLADCYAEAFALF